MTVEVRSTFSLLDEAWIPCLMDDGSVESFGLKQVLAEATRVRDVVGELPTQTFAIVRLLLAILHRALGEELETKRDWARLWSGGLPIAEAQEYLEEFRDRFDLLHPEQPFYQVAGLRTAKDEVKGVSALLFDVPPNFRLFTGRAGTALDGLSYAEAARWLLHAHAYDVSGIKSGLVGDDRVKGGKGYPIGTGWCGELGGLLIEGTNLAETLMLSLVPRTGRDAYQDVPPWERPPDTAAARNHENPRGSVDLFTWQSRRIRLVDDGSRVTGCVVGNGDKITPQNRYAIEPLTAWRFSKPQTQKNKGMPVFMPRVHRSEYMFWRGISGLTVQRVESGAASGPPAGFAPPVIAWLVELQVEGYLPMTQPIAPRAIGVEYGTQNSVVVNLVDDRLTVLLSALDAEGHPELSAAARAAVAAAEMAVGELAKFAGNLALAAGGNAEGPRERAREEGFSTLDMPFRSWLRQLGGDPASSPEGHLDRWKDTVRELVTRLGSAEVDASGSSAWQGRMVRLSAGERLINTSLAERWFHSGLRRALARLADEGAHEHDGEKE
ncbi:MAG: type I-E CRISPR-associated protein Cse1/CasA, partial [Actinobacteria bacterium]|nr:type I-E CRISPR-associated protein Cse1/CasA [Actinomycetota bacterium]